MRAPALTDLQLAVMQVLWTRGEATVHAVHRSLTQRLAPTTVATLLSRLEKRGLVTHRAEGRQYVYRAQVGEAEVRRTVVRRLRSLADRWFDGSVASVMVHLLGDRKVTPEELARIKQLIEAKERELPPGKP
ncbi:MAG TPA: BlaI/MecI/CopY family transcriptional regulator [Gemmatimonadales bacterium]